MVIVLGGGGKRRLLLRYNILQPARNQLPSRRGPPHPTQPLLLEKRNISIGLFFFPPSFDARWSTRWSNSSAYIYVILRPRWWRRQSGGWKEEEAWSITSIKSVARGREGDCFIFGAAAAGIDIAREREKEEMAGLTRAIVVIFCAYALGISKERERERAEWYI